MTEDELLYHLLWKKYNAIDPSKIFFTEEMQGGTWVAKLAGKSLKPAELANLQSEALMIKRSRLWGIMTETLKNTAHAHLFTQLKVLEDSKWGKAVLYALSIEEKILTGIENAHVNRPPQTAATQFQATRTQ